MVVRVSQPRDDFVGACCVQSCRWTALAVGAHMFPCGQLPGAPSERPAGLSLPLGTCNMNPDPRHIWHRRLPLTWALSCPSRGTEILEGRVEVGHHTGSHSTRLTMEGPVPFGLWRALGQPCPLLQPAAVAWGVRPLQQRPGVRSMGPVQVSSPFKWDKAFPAFLRTK